MTKAKHSKIKKLFAKSWAEIKRVLDFWSQTKAGTFGSSVAYYAIFSFAPILVIAISISSFFVSRTSVTDGLVAEVTGVFGQNGASLVDSLLKANVSQNTSVISSILGFIVLLLGASGVFAELQKALDAIFETLPDKGKRGIWQTIQKKFLSYGMVLSLGFILLVSLALSSVISFFSARISSIVPGADILAHGVDLLISVLLISFFLTLMYKVLPSHRLRWKPAMVGGLIAGILFTVSKYALGLYLGSSSKFDSFGAASALVFLVMWTYYMAQVFFLGAVLTRLYVVPKLK